VITELHRDEILRDMDRINKERQDRGLIKGVFLIAIIWAVIAAGINLYL